MRLFEQHLQLTFAAANALDDLGRSLLQELFVAKLAMGVSLFGFELGDFFREALALGCDIDFLFVNGADVEAGSAARVSGFRERLLGEADRFNVGEALDGAAIAMPERPDV